MYCISIDCNIYQGPSCIKQLDFDVCVKLHGIPNIIELYIILCNEMNTRNGFVTTKYRQSNLNQGSKDMTTKVILRMLL